MLLEGLDSIIVEYNGVIWYFVMEVNCDFFVVLLDVYVFVYDGYCVYVLVYDCKVCMDLLVYQVVDGVFYMNFLVNIECCWEEDIFGYIECFEVYWLDYELELAVCFSCWF